MSTLNVDKLWRDFGPDLRLYILRRVSDPGTAEDILQETFLKIHSQLDTLRETCRFRSWMYRIAGNAIIDHYRAVKPTVELSDLPLSSQPDDTDVTKRLIPCVEGFVEKLPDKYRLAILLTEYEGMTQEQMGEKLGLSLSGAKARVQRARKKLKTMLTECCKFEFDGQGRIISYERKPRSVQTVSHSGATPRGGY